ncbi:MAG: hypothetical protein AB7O26_03790 [Planctomycetaceae bacterium]
MKQTVFGLGILAALALVSYRAAVACPFCSAPSLTLSEQVQQSDAVALVSWTEGVMPKDQDPGSTVYEVVQIVKSPKGTMEKGTKITLVRYRAGKPGDLFMLLGTKGMKENTLDWGSPTEVTDTSFQYIAQAPSPEAPPQKRLAYFMKFLEFPDPLVTNDAYGEFANAPYKEIAPLAPTFPREKLREWVTSKETSPTRLGLYGLMLGLCGTQEDAELMEKKIAEPSQEFRLGIDGVMSGYLLLTGDKGLDKIDTLKLADKKVPFSETYAAMQALRFMWTYAEGKIPKERLMQSMRILLDRPELADLVIADLARWGDWSLQDRLMELYDSKDYTIPSIKRAIVRYMLQSTKFESKDPKAEPPAHVAVGKKHLDALRAKDPKTVKEAERFFFLN